MANKITITSENSAFSAYVSLFQKYGCSQPIILRVDKDKIFFKYLHGPVRNFKCFICRCFSIGLCSLAYLYVSLGRLYGHFGSIPFWILLVQIMFGIVALYTMWTIVVCITKGDILEMGWGAVSYQIQEYKSGKYTLDRLVASCNRGWDWNSLPRHC